MPVQQIDEPQAMDRLDQVQHFMHHRVLQQVFRLLDPFGTQADRVGYVIATAPLGIPTLKEVGGDPSASLP